MRCRPKHFEHACRIVCLSLAVAVLSITYGVKADPFTTNQALAATLKQAALADHVTLHQFGKSVKGQALWAVQIQAAAKSDHPCVALLIGQQHGDEPAGAEALIDIVEHLSADAKRVTAGLELWVVPRANPDGAEAGLRRNANDFDLNRDHVILSQPETRALHALARKVNPHLAVDCHEFNRDSADYREQGWSEWPLIMMDTANLALMPEALYRLGVRLCEAPTKLMAEAGFNYQRYIVGDCPCSHGSGELRHSTLDPDDARNGLSVNGCLSFIIESGISRKHEDPDHNLQQRVAANRVLLNTLISSPSVLGAVRKTVQAARTEPAPLLIPTNTIWANLQPRMTEVQVIDMKTQRTRSIQTPTMVHQRIVKSAVVAPDGYVIDASAAKVFEDFLSGHGIEFDRLREPAQYRVQPIELVRIENEYDVVYHRYAGRQITKVESTDRRSYPAGSLILDLKEQSPNTARRCMLVLEPLQLYGLYQWPAFANLVSSDGVLPVARLMPDRPPENSE